MLLSHRWRFIFIKTRKTAGTSVEMALAPHCGPRDVITPITAEDEAQRRAAGVYPQNYLPDALNPLVGADLNLHRPLGHGARLLFQAFRLPRFYNHMPAVEVRDRVPREVWDSYYKFTIERNPLDRAVSQYFWKTRKAKRPPPVADFLRGGGFTPNFPLYTIDGEVAVDRVLDFDRLGDELRSVCDHLGVPWDGELPRAKGKSRPRGSSWRELLTEDDVAWVRQTCAPELAVLGRE